METNQVLTIPERSSVRFDRNFIDVAVCELRFPTLLELETKPPLQLQARLRKKYPGYEKQELLDRNSLEGVPGRYRYLFRSKTGDWTITIHSGAISLETRKYTAFEDFFDRLNELLDFSAPLIDSDFFTRVGLRYINKIPVRDGELNGWVNDELSSPLINGPYGQVTAYTSEVRGYTEIGEYMFRHAVKERKGGVDAFVLDFDYFKEDVELKDTPTLIRAFNKINFSFFYWCLGHKAITELGAGRPTSSPRSARRCAWNRGTECSTSAAVRGRCCAPGHAITASPASAST